MTDQLPAPRFPYQPLCQADMLSARGRVCLGDRLAGYKARAGGRELATPRVRSLLADSNLRHPSLRVVESGQG